MWNKEKCNYVDNKINTVRDTFLRGDKDNFTESLIAVEEDTGYEIDFLYDIFVEIIEDEMEDGMDYDEAVYNAAESTVTISYEQDW